MQIGREHTVAALGRTWRLKRLTTKEIFAFRDWVARELGDPFEVVDRYLDRLKDDKEKLAWIKEAQAIKDQLKMFSLQCEVARKYLATEAGAVQLFRLLLSDNPGADKLKDDEVMEIASGFADEVEGTKINGTTEAIPALIEHAGGSLPNVPAPA